MKSEAPDLENQAGQKPSSPKISIFKFLTSIIMPGIVGRKIGMTRISQDDGRVIPVTLVHCPPNIVAQIKTSDKDGYPAIVLGFEALKKPRKTKKYRLLREFRIKKPEEYKLGDKISVERFKELKEASVTGTSKGKGFAGVIKRYHFSSGPGSHGSHQHREPGSVGARAKPGRIIKGKRMAGRMGNERITLKNRPIMQIDPEKNLIVVRGAVPGPTKGIIILNFK